MADAKKGYGIALLSGGLDSILAIRILLEQGVKVEALHFGSIYSDTTIDIQAVARHLGVRVDVLNHTDALTDAIHTHRFGFGKHLNPCIDCRIRMVQRADKIRAERGADFLVSGEVLGQRPMSQRRMPMDMVEHHAGVKGRLLRPLCACHLTPTEAETEGLVDRGKLLDLSGRSRRPQFDMAEKYGIQIFLTPAGGCLLTHADFAVKVKDLLDHGQLTSEAVGFLRLGRHFRLEDGSRIVIGRNERDNLRLLALAVTGDALLRTVSLPGPVTLVSPMDPGRVLPSTTLLRVARWTAAYTKVRQGETVDMELLDPGSETPRELLVVTPVPRNDFACFRIGAVAKAACEE